MALLWPESSPDRARHLLRELLYRLRESLGEDALTSASDAIHLDPTRIACDAWDFEAAFARGDWAEADRVYGGPLLDGFFIDGAPDFERWADGERTRLAALHARALESLAAERGARGEWLEAVALWRRRAGADPLDARVTRQLMEALDAAGDRAAALRQGALHAALLESELGAAPDPAVAALAARLRSSPARREHGEETGPRPAFDARRDPAGAERAVMAASGMEAPSHPPADAPLQARPAEGRAAAPARGGSWRRRALAGLAFAVTVALLAAGYFRADVRVAERRLDPERIAVVPFRTSGADPELAFLGDGMVELLSLALDGDAGPSAVDPGEVLRAWERDEGPATSAAARRAARRLGAGQVVVGAVVGGARRLTVNASIVDAGSGAVRVAPVEVSGSADSLSAIVGALAAKLLVRGAGAWRLGGDAPESTSAEVLRAYLRGMVEFRKGDLVAAGTQLFGALEMDSSFVPAAYQFALIHAILAPTTPLGAPPSRDGRLTRLYGRLWRDRHHLGAQRRLLLEAVADSLNVRWRMQALPRLERAAALLPNSAEAWDILGEDYYHAGALVGREDWPARARESFLRARALDPRIAVNARTHLADLAFIERDGRAHARHAAAATGTRGAAYVAYQAALLRGRARAVGEARAEYARAWAIGEGEGIDWTLQGMTLPAGELDSLLGHLEAGAATAEQRRLVAEWRYRAALLQGRPAGGAALLARHLGADTAAASAALLDHALGHRAEEERVLRAIPADVAKQRHPDACNVALSRLRRDDTTGVAAILATEPPLDPRLPAAAAVATVRRGVVAQAAICGEVLRGVLASRSPEGEPLLRRADSVMRLIPVNYADFWNHDVALAFARRGAWREAAAASRRRFHDLLPLPRLVVALRDEGRWAALAGDTAAAVRAYRHYLMWRARPEPALVPQRDSVRAELEALGRR